MAKGKKRSKPDARSPAFASPTRLRSRSLALNPLLVDDRRSFDFAPASRPARLFTGATASVTATPRTKTKTKNSMPAFQQAFVAPQATLVCVRRHQRKEILHAFNKTGKRGQRKPRRSKWSNTKC